MIYGLRNAARVESRINSPKNWQPNSPAANFAGFRAGRFPTAETAAIASRRAICETLAAHRADVKLWASPDSTAWTVVFEHDVRFHFSPLNRFIYVKPVPDLATALRGADEVREKVSTVGLGAPAEKAKLLALGIWPLFR